MVEPKAHTLPEAARISGASRTKLYEEMAAGRLQARKLGRRTVILSSDLDAWLVSVPAMKARAT
jgi:excisionase family DNA binding protein